MPPGTPGVHEAYEVADGTGSLDKATTFVTCAGTELLPTT
jgi:hypothetical protein